jgi:hypothetical protein
MNNLSHQSKQELYNIVRIDVVNFIKEKNLDLAEHYIQNYSIFNRHWNDSMRHSYNLPESYIWLPEFEYLCDLARNKKQYEQSFMNRLYHNIFGYKFRNAFDTTFVCTGVASRANIMGCTFETIFCTLFGNNFLDVLV